ncbi:MAG: zinc-binding alcohol dehydrogenase family protein [Deltaproteobacteria bacterium]|nr:MAG: zinc-binding alcohol dehydrogenase family protein [Deltaproteobacteria bacterium]
MSTLKADAWVLYAGEDPKNPTPAELKRETYEFPDITEDEVLCEPLYGCWEGNMGHALERKPVDICRQRGEEKVVIGNAGVVRVVRVGKKVRSVEPGRHAIIFCTGVEDEWGYPKKILAYDAPGTMGVLATQMKVKERQLIPVPEDTRHSLPQWAAFSLRYITAWSNWELAQGTFRLLVSWDEMASPHVWGWGGGVTLAELDLARRHGARAVGLSGSDRRLEEIRAAGITAIDRRTFGELAYDPERYRSDPEYKRRYLEAESAFLEEVRCRTKGRMVQIFIDYVGGPVWRPTLKALSREGVVTTAGWKEGMKLQTIRAIECIERHQHIHTHYARYPQGWKAVYYAEANGWIPTVDERIYTFDEIPELAANYAAGNVGNYPCFSINPE